MRRSLRVNIADVTARLKRGTGKCGASMGLSGAARGALPGGLCSSYGQCLDGPGPCELPLTVCGFYRARAPVAAFRGLAGACHCCQGTLQGQKRWLSHYAALTGLAACCQRPLGPRAHDSVLRPLQAREPDLAGLWFRLLLQEQHAEPAHRRGLPPARAPGCLLLIFRVLWRARSCRLCLLRRPYRGAELC